MCFIETGLKFFAALTKSGCDGRITALSERVVVVISLGVIMGFNALPYGHLVMSWCYVVNSSLIYDKIPYVISYQRPTICLGKQHSSSSFSPVFFILFTTRWIFSLFHICFPFPPNIVISIRFKSNFSNNLDTYR